MPSLGQKLKEPAVKTSGAVSPTTRAIPRKMPVIMAGAAAGTITFMTVCAEVALRAELARRSALVTVFKAPRKF